MNLVGRGIGGIIDFSMAISCVTVYCSPVICVAALAGSLFAQIAKDVIIQNATADMISGSLLYMSKVALLSGIGGVCAIVVLFPVGILIANVFGDVFPLMSNFSFVPRRC